MSQEQICQLETTFEEEQEEKDYLEVASSMLHMKAENEKLAKRNEQLTAELHISQAKNQETSERNRELDAKIRELEAKSAQTDVGQLIKYMEEKGENLKNCEVSRLQDSLDAKNNEIASVNHLLRTKNIELQNERIERLRLAQQLGNKVAVAAKLSGENAKVKKELCDIQKRLTAEIKRKSELLTEKLTFNQELNDSQNKLETAEKRIADLEKELEEMQLSWELLRHLLGETTKWMGKKKAESKDEQSLQQQSMPRLVPSALDGSVPATNKALKQELEENKAEVDAALVDQPAVNGSVADEEKVDDSKDSNVVSDSVVTQGMVRCVG
ncbi:hypothetical protein Ddc_18518 [Ditylenchus destructor]|nr:hypothetical protein Ddc_18518 [Ditylenchus destructor]